MLSPRGAWNHDFDIFIHEKNQFWPRSDMLSFGQPKAVTIHKNDEVEVSFTVKYFHRMRTQANKCNKVFLDAVASLDFGYEGGREYL